MNKTLKKVAILGSILILFLFIVFVINQTAQVVELADKVSPRFGNIVFWLLVTVYAFLILIPMMMVLRLPPTLSPPSSKEAPEFGIYLKALRKRLASNPHIKGMDLSNQQQIEKALAILANKANEIIHQTSATVFKHGYFAKWAFGCFSCVICTVPDGLADCPIILPALYIDLGEG